MKWWEKMISALSVAYVFSVVLITTGVLIGMNLHQGEAVKWTDIVIAICNTLMAIASVIALLTWKYSKKYDEKIDAIDKLYSCLIELHKAYNQETYRLFIEEAKQLNHQQVLWQSPMLTQKKAEYDMAIQEASVQKLALVKLSEDKIENFKSGNITKKMEAIFKDIRASSVNEKEHLLESINDNYEEMENFYNGLLSDLIIARQEL